MSASLKGKRPLITKSFRLLDFQVYDNVVDPIESSDNGSEPSDGSGNRPQQNAFTIQMFGVNELGETCSMTVTDFKPFFFIMVAPDWTQADAGRLLSMLRGKVNDYDNNKILKCDLVEYAKLYGFAPNTKEKFCRVEFQNSTTMKRVVNLWYNYSKVSGKRISVPFQFQKTQLVLYETFIPPLLRYFHLNNISPSGWVALQVTKMVVPEQRTTTCKYEYITTQQYIVAQPEKETAVPYKICSFDIEASSSHGDFPQPTKTYKRLAGNIVDYMVKHASDINDGQIEQLIKRCIMAAFGYSRFDGVDLVYPKTPINKIACGAKADRLLAESLAGAIELDEQCQEAKQLESYFTKMNKELNSKEEEEEDDDCDSDANGLTLETTTELQGIKTYLLSHNITYKQKVAKLDELLMKFFPKLEGDRITMIGSTFMRCGEAMPYLNTCLVVDTCDQVSAATIESFPSERELLLRWTRLIQEENPDIIIGYNIFGFDYPFMHQRAKEVDCEEGFLSLSRIRGHVSANRNEKAGRWDLGNTKCKVASGEYNLFYPLMVGRQQIDLLPYYRKGGFNYSSYTLDNVASLNIKDDVKRIKVLPTGTPEGCTRIYTTNVTGLQPHDFIHVVKEKYTTNSIQDGVKFHVLAIEKEGDQTVIIVDNPITEPLNFADKLTKIQWGLAKDDVSVQDIFRLTKGSSTDRAVVAKYCIQDCNIVQHLFRKQDIMTEFSEMARLCTVPITYLVFRGQGIKLTSFVAKKCMEQGALMPDLLKSSEDAEDEGYEGAVVLSPKCGIYVHNPVACLDYSSLYPSLMQSQNLSHDSKVRTWEYDLDGNLLRETGSPEYDNLPNYTYVDIEFDTYDMIKKTPNAKTRVKVKSGKKVCRWAKGKGTFPGCVSTQEAPCGNFVAILPTIVDELLKTRKATKLQMKGEKDPFMKNILDKRQNTYKLTANSLYGQCGSPTSTFYEKDIASCITAMGRRMIMYAKRMVEEVYCNRICPSVKYLAVAGGDAVRTRAEYVYGDTDSVFFTFNLEDPQTGQKIIGKPALEITIELAQQVAQLCSKYLSAPMELCYEKTLMPFIIFTKKRYVGVLYEDDPNKGKLKIMGLSIKRRDSCDYMKDVYGGILDIFIEGQPDYIQQSIEYLNNALNALSAGNVPNEKLTITKALRGSYANPESQCHWVLSERIGVRDPGNKPKSGDRVAYLYFENNTKVAKGTKLITGDMIETPQYIKDHKLKVDYGHYITNQLMKPISQLLGLALEDILRHFGKHKALAEFERLLVALKRECGDDLQQFFKLREKETSNQIQALLFTNAITAVNNKRNRITTIDTLFAKKK
jgi:DNA polymerase elongation subunit (family B)